MPVDCQTYLSCQAVTNLRIFLAGQEIQANFAGARSTPRGLRASTSPQRARRYI
jgi:hypothetical protein